MMDAPELTIITQDTTPAPQNPNAALFAKLARVMGRLQRVPKNARHPHHGYMYASADDVFDAVRAALAAENLAILPTFIKFEQKPLENSKQVRTWATFDFTFACGDTGATWTCRWEAEADDTQDKGLNKVATAAMKYFLLKTFVLSTGDSDEEGEDDGAAPAQQNGKVKPERRIPPPDVKAKAADNGQQSSTAWNEETSIAWVNKQIGNGHSDIELRTALLIESKWSEWDGTVEEADKALDNYIQAQMDAAKAEKEARDKARRGA